MDLTHATTGLENGLLVFGSSASPQRKSILQIHTYVAKMGLVAIMGAPPRLSLRAGKFDLKLNLSHIRVFFTARPAAFRVE
jgi:hypothetical protein